MKSLVFGIALLGMPAIAMAQTGTKTPAPAPGQSEWAPGQRAKGPGDAKDFAPGQRMQEKDVKKYRDQTPLPEYRSRRGWTPAARRADERVIAAWPCSLEC